MPHTNFNIELRSSYFSTRALCEPRSYEREACAIFFMMFYHVPKRPQLFFELPAIILMPSENVLMYRIRAVSGRAVETGGKGRRTADAVHRYSYYPVGLGEADTQSLPMSKIFTEMSRNG